MRHGSLPFASSMAIVASLQLVLVAAPATGQGPHLPQIGEPIPCLAFELLADGSRPEAASLRGKAVVIDFWASWCPPCIAAFPRLSQLHRELAGEGIELFSVTYEPESFVRRFLADHPLESTVGIDASFETFVCFQAWAIPVAFVFDRQGRLGAAVHPDRLDRQLIEAVARGEAPPVQQSEPWHDPAGAERYFRELQAKLLAQETAGDGP